jgi:hypothetical protein
MELYGQIANKREASESIYLTAPTQARDSAN